MQMHRRAIRSTLAARLAEATVVRLTGPRSAGKTTSCLMQIEERGGSAVLLDDPDIRRAVAADPRGYLAGLRRPVLIDEYQRVPDVLDFIKADLAESDSGPGVWLLCGSVSIAATHAVAQSLGGRLTDVTMGTLTVDERNDRPEPTFIAELLEQGPDAFSGRRVAPQSDRKSLLAEAVRGGFPLITDRVDQESRRRGFDDWVRASVVADAQSVGGVRNVEDLLRMLRLYAASTASVTPKDRPLADALEIDRRTVAKYRDLFASLYVTWDLPALVPGNASGQVVKSPKLHLVDSGLAAAVAQRDTVGALERDPHMAGALVETMVVNDCRVQASVHPSNPRLYHFREDSREVDLVIERPNGQIVGVEVKLTSNPGDKEFAGLRRLRESAGSRWFGGIVVCRVPAGRVTVDGLALAPMDVVWNPRR